MYSYATSSEALNDLIKRGFISDCNVLSATDLKKARVIAFYRFEGMTDPGDEEIVFALELIDGRKGTLLSSYGPHADVDLAGIKDLNFQSKDLYWA